MVILEEIRNFEDRDEEFSLFEYGIADMREDMHLVRYPSTRVENLQLNSLAADHIIRIRFHQRVESGSPVEECTLYLRFRNLRLELSDNIQFNDLYMTGSVTAQRNNAGFDILYGCNHVYIFPENAHDFESDRVDARGRSSYMGYRILLVRDMRGRSHIYIEPVAHMTLAVAA